MKIGVIADVHVGNHGRFAKGTMQAGINWRAQLVLDSLRNAAIAAGDAGCDVLVVCGDLFDTAQPSPQLIAAVQSAIADSRVPGCVYLLGNHEMVSTLEGDHALGPLPWRKAEIVTKPCTQVWDKGLDVHFVPYAPVQNGGAYLAEELAKLSPAAPVLLDSVLFMHMGIKDSDTPAYLRNAHDAIHVDELRALCIRHGISVVFAGNWHDHRCWPMAEGEPGQIIQVGALCPTGFDNPSVLGEPFDPYGSLVLYNLSSGEITRKSIPGPRFYKATSAEEALGIITSGHGRALASALFVQVTVAPSVMGETRSILAGVQEPTVRIEILPDVTIVRKQISRAALGARAAGTVDSALDEYVHRMPLDDDLERRTILARCKDLLAGV